MDSILRILEQLPLIRAIVGLVLVLFLPGFAWTLLLFRQINIIERITLSLGLSIVVVTLSILVTNRLMSIQINGLNSALIIIVVTILPLIAYYLNRLIKRHRGSVA